MCNLCEVTWKNCQYCKINKQGTLFYNKEICEDCKTKLFEIARKIIYTFNRGTLCPEQQFITIKKIIIYDCRCFKCNKLRQGYHIKNDPFSFYKKHKIYKDFSKDCNMCNFCIEKQVQKTFHLYIDPYGHIQKIIEKYLNCDVLSIFFKYCDLCY